jgi:hypothetical protein
MSLVQRGQPIHNREGDPYGLPGQHGSEWRVHEIQGRMPERRIVM